jgi:hypothetical protein
MKLRFMLLMLTAGVALTATSSASAISFYGSKTGSLKLTGVGDQEFKIAAALVVCEGLEGNGNYVSQVSFSTLVLQIPTKCEAFGKAATVGPGSILTDADGTVVVRPPDPYTFTSAVGKCSVRFAPEGTSKGLGTVKFVNNASGTITEESSISGLPYEVHTSVTGSICGEIKETGDATFKGTAELSLVGGTISVK